MKVITSMRFGLLFVLLAALYGCASSGVENVRGQPSTYIDPQGSGAVSGTGIESQDIIAMTDEMMRDLLSSRVIAGRDTPPRIFLDSSLIRNESSQPINVNLLTERLRSQLIRASEGRIVFVARDSAEAIEEERQLAREGVVDGGTIRQAERQAGVDFRMRGRIMSQDAVDQRSQMRDRYNLINFELMDMELGTIVWSGMYEMRRASQDHILYR